MKNDKVVIVCDYDFNQEKALILLDNMLERNIDGLIFQGVHLTEEIMKKLKRFNCPVVLGNQGPPEDMECEFTTVTVDSYRAMKDATKFLIGEGHKRIAYIGGGRGLHKWNLAFEWFYRCYERSRTFSSGFLYLSGSIFRRSRRKGMNYIYENNLELPTAVVTGSDVIAVGVIRCLKSHNMKVPEDISVMGFDDSLSDIYEPPLSTVRMSEQGEIFYDALFGDNKEKWRYFPHQIVRRNSTRRFDK